MYLSLGHDSESRLLMFKAIVHSPAALVRLTRKRSRLRWYVRVISVLAWPSWLLHGAFIGGRRGGEAGAQRVPGEFLLSFGFGEIGREYRPRARYA